MIKQHLATLKKQGNFSWSELAEKSGLPDPTIRKIFSGETADPRFETVARLVIAMGGSLDEIAGNKKEEPKEILIEEPKEENKKEHASVQEIKEVYEARIAEIKNSAAEHLESVKKDKRYLALACAFLGAFTILWLLIDLLIGSVGWFRY